MASLTTAQWKLLRELYAMAPHIAQREALSTRATTLRVLARRGFIASWVIDGPAGFHVCAVVLSRRGAVMVEAFFPDDVARVWNVTTLLPHVEASS